MSKSKLTTLNICLFAFVLFFVTQAVSAQFTIGNLKKVIQKNNGDKSTNDKTSSDKNSGDKPPSERNGPKKNDAENLEVQTNPHAPTDYDANLNVGDQAIAVGKFRDLDAVKIVGKSGGVYRVTKVGSDSVEAFSTNSVYPYFDAKAFSSIMYDYKHFVTPYLPCYGKKHNLEEGNVTEEGYNAFGARRFSNADDAKKELGPEQAKLAELANLLNSKLSGHTPNTFLQYADNPAIVAEIANQRAEYLNCVVDTEQEKPDFRLGIFLDDIKKAQGEVDRYTSPDDFLYLVSAGASSEQLLNAVSKKAREEYAAAWLKNPKSRAEFDAAWDALAASATKKIPLYKPSAASYKFRYPAGEKLLMDSFKSTATMKIFRVGTDTAGWDIQKDSSNFPSYRYKDVQVYFRDSSDDHPYCRVVSARVKQDYAGGGTYNSTIYRSSVSSEIFGCP